MASIREFGIVLPALIDKDNVIIAGEGRIEAARRLGRPVFPAIRARHLSDA